MFGRPGKSTAPVSVVLYTRAGCGLCDEMLAEIGRAGRADYTLTALNVDADRALKKEFGLRVPVLEIAGEVAFEGRLTRSAFEQRLEAAQRAAGGGR